MTLDRWLVKHLNHWGENHSSLVKVFSNDLVYFIILASLFWLILRVYTLHKPNFDLWKFTSDLILKGIFIFAIPVGTATLISEIISRLYVRQRPFVAMQGIKLLVPHAADGGMPSHHVVFMTAALTMIYFYNRYFALSLLLLTLITGVARVTAGIHYPSDILVGLLIGSIVSWIYFAFLQKQTSGIFIRGRSLSYRMN